MRLRHHVLLAHLGDPLDRRVPVVVDVVVVEDHRAGDGREQPADHRLAPRGDVELHVVVVARRPPSPSRSALDVPDGPRRRRPGRRAAAARAATPRARRRASAAPARAARRPRGRRDARPCAACRAARAARRRGRSRRRSAPGRRRVCVRSTLGGKRLSGSGQTTSPSSATSYGVARVAAAARSHGRARSGGPRR